MKKLSNVLLTVFAVGILACLFAGGLSLFGYAAALLIGGETAEALCTFIFKTWLPVVIKLTSAVTGTGLAGMYFSRQTALAVTTEK